MTELKDNFVFYDEDNYFNKEIEHGTTTLAFCMQPREKIKDFVIEVDFDKLGVKNSVAYSEIIGHIKK